MMKFWRFTSEDIFDFIYELFGYDLQNSIGGYVNEVRDVMNYFHEVRQPSPTTVRKLFELMLMRLACSYDKKFCKTNSVVCDIMLNTRR